MNAVTIYKVPSRRSIQLEFSELLVGGRLELYPHVEEKGLLFLQFRGDKVAVSAGPYIGRIPLTPSISIEVEPKLPVRNLSRVLDIARGSIGQLSGIDRAYLAQEERTDSILEFMGENLLAALVEIEERGFHKEYQPLTEKTSHPSGKVRYSDTVSKCWSRGELHRVWTQRFIHTANTALNRVIKSALHLLLTKVDGVTPNAKSLLQRANQAFNRFPDIVGQATLRDLRDCHDVLRRRALPVSKAYYYNALDVSNLIISNKGVSLQSPGDDVVLNTFILNFEILFEKYLLGVLSAKCPDTVSVLDGNAEGRKPLFDDRQQPPAQPDIILERLDSDRRLVAEVKYKDKPGREDINQALTYAMSFRTRSAVLLFQSKPGAQAGPRTIGEVNGVILKGYAFDLDSSDLFTEEHRFAQFMLNELNS